MPLDMELPEAPDMDDGPCKASSAPTPIPMQMARSQISVDHSKHTGTMVFRCDGKGDKDYRWVLVKKKDSTGGGVNSDKYEFSDLNIGHEIEINVTGREILRAEEASILTLISTAQLSELRPTSFLASLQPQLSLMTFPVFLTALTDQVQILTDMLRRLQQ